MRSSTVCGWHRLSVAIVPPGHAGPWLTGNVVIAANNVFLQDWKNRVLRERHGPQAIAGTSSRAVNLAQNIEPEYHLAGSHCLGLSLAHGLVPAQSVQLLNVGVRYLPGNNRGVGRRAER